MRIQYSCPLIVYNMPPIDALKYTLIDYAMMKQCVKISKIHGSSAASQMVLNHVTMHSYS